MREPRTGLHIVIVGLGNPGPEYARTRHNLGFMVADELVRQASRSWRRAKEKAHVADIRIEDLPATVVKPQTYMNLSGRAVAPLLARLAADPARMVVVHDDLDLLPWRIRIKAGGGDGGHKGLRSISESLRFTGFIRVRLGIGRPPEGVSPEEFVLSALEADEESERDEFVSRAVDAVKLIVSQGVERAQNLLHLKEISTKSPDSEN